MTKRLLILTVCVVLLSADNLILGNKQFNKMLNSNIEHMISTSKQKQIICTVKSVDRTKVDESNNEFDEWKKKSEPLWTKILSGEFELHKELYLLTPEVAEFLVKNVKNTLSFDNLRQIDEKTASILSNYKGRLFVFNYFHKFPTESQIIMTNYKGLLYLMNIDELTVEFASILIKTKGKLYFDKLDEEEMSLEIAKILSQYKGFTMVFSHFHSFKKSIQEELIKFKGHFILKGIDIMTEELAKLLVNIKGELYLDEVRNIDINSAKILVEAKSHIYFYHFQKYSDRVKNEFTKLKDLFLYGVEHLTVDLAKILLGNNGHLSLPNLKFIDLDAAKCIVEHKQSLAIGIDDLTVELARVLSQYKGNSLQFYKLKSLTQETANMLNNFAGKHLVFYDLINLSENAAEALSKNRHFALYFMALNADAISTEVAKNLISDNYVELNLSGLKILTYELAEVLVHHKGPLSLDIRSISLKVAEKLSEFQSSPLDLITLTSVSDEVAKALSKYKGQLVVNSEIKKIIEKYKD